MGLFKKKKEKEKVKQVEVKRKPKRRRHRRTKTSKFRITSEIAFTGSKKNPLKSKMSGFFVKFSFKDDEPKKR